MVIKAKTARAMSQLISDLQAYYRDFIASDPAGLESFYDAALVFRDPLHELQGLPAVTRYFEGMREGLLRCEFEFDPATVSTNSACLPWYMHYAHASLSGGQPLTLRGCSLLRFEQKITYHEDFYDLGSMVYERVPLLGAVVRGVKSRLAGPATEG